MFILIMYMYIGNFKLDIFYVVNKEFIWNVENLLNIFNGNFLCKDFEIDCKVIWKNMKFK